MYFPNGVSIKIWGSKGVARKIVGGKNVKNAHEARKNVPFYAEIVKFRLIMTHLKLFWGIKGGQENILGQIPPSPLWSRHCTFLILLVDTHIETFADKNQTCNKWRNPWASTLWVSLAWRAGQVRNFEAPPRPLALV